MKPALVIAFCTAAGLLVISCTSRQGVSRHVASLDGARIYEEQCVRCHGGKGEGVAGKHDETLYGERSVDSLARLIARTMPEDRDAKTPPDEAAAVAAYIHGAFYSPAARAKANPAKVEFSRLTNRQYRESVADLIASFRPVKQAKHGGGLAAEYYQSEGMNKKKAKVLERTDKVVAFDYGEGSPAEGITADQFSIAWNGSLLAPETGLYDFRITTSPPATATRATTVTPNARPR
jgi:mono/diheme cytochrome c family protein